MYKKRRCPCCESEKISPVKVETDVKPYSLSFDQVKQYWAGFFKEKVIFDYVRCLECGLLYNKKYFDQDDLNLLYASMEPNMDLVPVSAIEATQYGYFSQFEKFANFDGVYLELGPDVGHFLKFVVNKNKNTAYVLIEPNQLVHGDLASVLSGKCFSLQQSISDLEKIEDNTLTEVVLIQVLDHLIQPAQFLKLVHRKLKYGGSILTVTHDERSFLARLLGKRWPAYCLQHPQVYNEKSIKKLFESSGYFVANISKTKNHFQVGFLLKHIAWIFGLNMNFKWSILNHVVGLRLGNIATIAQKK
jgi:hypothetical protein